MKHNRLNKSRSSGRSIRVKRKRVRYVIDHSTLGQKTNQHLVSRGIGIIIFFILMLLIGLGFVAWLVFNSGF